MVMESGASNHPPMTRHPYHLVAMLLLADALAAHVTAIVLLRTLLA